MDARSRARAVSADAKRAAALFASVLALAGCATRAGGAGSSLAGPSGGLPSGGLPSGRLPAGAVLVDSGKPGPLLLVVAGMHGDEPSGPLAARILASFGADAALPGQSWSIGRGALLVLPEANPEACSAGLRESPPKTGLPAEDLNRLFPGHRRGGEGPARAAEIFAAALGADLSIDLHESGWAWTEADSPSLVLSPAAAPFALELLEALDGKGAPFAFTGGAPYGSLVWALGAKGRAAIGVEAPARLSEAERIALHLAVVRESATLLGMTDRP